VSPCTRYCVRSALGLLGVAPPPQDGLFLCVGEGGEEGLHAVPISFDDRGL
jgi:hypothetical protein